MRTLGIVTGARSDWGIYRPILAELRKIPAVKLRILATGMHLAPEFGHTVDQIADDGFASVDKVESLLASDTPAGIAKSIAVGVAGFADLFSRARPDLLVVLGDRFEMYAAALAALPFIIPVAHIHGGEVTEGALDDALRHGLTKLSHLHFASTQAYARRIRQLGEESWRITVSGAPSLDNIKKLNLPKRSEFETWLGRRVPDPFILVTFHPVTLEYKEAEQQANELLAALEAAEYPVLFTLPNADTNGRIIRRAIEKKALNNDKWIVSDNLGAARYFAVMGWASGMVGNSSSGIIEAASFKLPVVNVGSRQAGRLRPDNVIDVACNQRSILKAIRKATSPEFRRLCSRVRNPYYAGGAARLIAEKLASFPLDARLTRKRFSDLR